MPKQNHIPFLYDIFLPFQPYLRLLPRPRQTPRRQQIIPPHYFRPNKTLFDIAMNRPRRLHRRRSLSNRPRPHFPTTAAFGRPCSAFNLCRSTAVSSLSASSSPTFSTYSTGRADKNKNPPIDFLSSGV